MQMMQQLTGINFIFYFGTVFFTSLGTIKNPFLITLITSLVNTCSTPVSFYTVERFGRRKLLIVGATGMIIMQFIVGIVGVTAGKESKHNNAAVSAMVAFICFNISFFAATWGPCAWVVIGEIFPLPIRSRGVAISTSSNWFWNCVSCLRLLNRPRCFPINTLPYRSLLSSHPTLSVPRKVTPTSAPRFSSSGVPCAASPSPSHISSCQRPRVCLSNRSTRCWRRSRPASRHRGSHTPLLRKKWVSRRRACPSLLRPRILPSTWSPWGSPRSERKDGRGDCMHARFDSNHEVMMYIVK